MDGEGTSAPHSWWLSPLPLPPPPFRPARTYSLMAVLVHLGEVNSGHYVTYRWLPGQQWLFTSDTDTRLVPQAEVLRSQAYMLLYQRQRQRDAH